jgi:hypothetical protein
MRRLTLRCVNRRVAARQRGAVTIREKERPITKQKKERRASRKGAKAPRKKKKTPEQHDWVIPASKFHKDHESTIARNRWERSIAVAMDGAVA